MTNNALECRDVSPKEVCNFLSEHDRFLLLAHAQPDGDTVGSCFALAYALKKLGKKVKIDCSDKIPAKYSYFTAAFKNGNFKEETVIALDVADQKLFGLLNEKYGNCVDLCIDHHISNKRYAKRLFLNAAASANCENVYEIIKEHPSAYNQIPNIDRAISLINGEKVKNTFRKLEVIYIWGKTGAGKTRYVLEEYGYTNVFRVTNYKNPFDGYKNEDVILFDEFRSSLPIADMLTYLDGYPINLPCRYADKPAAFTKVYIISNIPIEKQYVEVQKYEPETYRAF